MFMSGLSLNVTIPEMTILIHIMRSIIIEFFLETNMSIHTNLMHLYVNHLKGKGLENA